MNSTVTLGRHASLGSRAHRPSVAPGAALLYLGLMAAWVYLVGNTPRAWHSPWNGNWVFFAALGLHLAVGLAIGRPRALLLPVVASLLAIPAGYAYGEHAGEFDLFPVVPIWEGILLAQIIFLPTMALGVIIRIWLRWRSGCPMPASARAFGERHG